MRIYLVMSNFCVYKIDKIEKPGVWVNVNHDSLVHRIYVNHEKKNFKKFQSV
jgi:hypothetical protein